jgi:hypothetical protein
LDGAGKRDRLQPSQIFIVEGLEEELRVALLSGKNHGISRGSHRISWEYMGIDWDLMGI